MTLKYVRNATVKNFLMFSFFFSLWCKQNFPNNFHFELKIEQKKFLPFFNNTANILFGGSSLKFHRMTCKFQLAFIRWFHEMFSKTWSAAIWMRLKSWYFWKTYNEVLDDKVMKIDHPHSITEFGLTFALSTWLFTKNLREVFLKKNFHALEHKNFSRFLAFVCNSIL